MTTTLKTLALSAAVAAVTGFAAAQLAVPATGANGTSATEDAIAAYIDAHPDAIIKSIEKYQVESVKAASSAALQENADALFKDTQSPFIGAADGDVVLVEFFDYNCGYCRRAFGELKALSESDPRVKIIFKDFPILGPTSETAAKWALAAHKQGKYFDFHQRLMEHQGAISDDVLEKVATDAGLDVAALKTDVEGATIMMQVESNRALAGKMKISGTPAFILGDELIPGAIGKDELVQKIAAIRAKAGTVAAPTAAPAAAAPETAPAADTPPAAAE
jgi:protein-disulfide isomerase